MSRHMVDEIAINNNNIIINYNNSQQVDAASKRSINHEAWLKTKMQQKDFLFVGLFTNFSACHMLDLFTNNAKKKNALHTLIFYRKLISLF